MCCHVVNILLNIVKCKMNQRILFDYWCECGVWRENKRLACVIRQLGMKRWRIVYPCTGRSSFKTNFFNEIRWPLLVINISFSTLTKLTKKTFFFFFFFFFFFLRKQRLFIVTSLSLDLFHIHYGSQVCTSFLMQIFLHKK
jgi:hypothetical protein